MSKLRKTDYIYLVKNKIAIVVLCFCFVSLVGCDKETTYENEIERINYLNKVWIDENWSSEEEYVYYSFIITKWEGNYIKGYFAINDIINPDIFIYSDNKQEEYGEFTGMIEGDEATCDMLWEDEKIDEVMKVQFMEKSKIKIVMSSNKDFVQSKINYLKPYSIYDEEDERAVFYDSESKVILEKWGNIKLVSRVRCDNTGRRVLFVYLTDNSGNILYDFAPPKYFPYDTFVYENSFNDINKDGLEDLILILSDGAEITQARVYLQNSNSGFEESDSLFEELNNKKNSHNQDIESVIDYLQLKRNIDYR